VALKKRTEVLLKTFLIATNIQKTNKEFHFICEVTIEKEENFVFLNQKVKNRHFLHHLRRNKRSF